MTQLSHTATSARVEVEFLSADTRVCIIPGDGNGDGIFNPEDLILAFEGGKYETGSPARCQEGDWNQDGRFDSDDLIFAFAAGYYRP